MAPFYFPVPLIAGLLWAFVHQMNRAQNQLLAISKILYRIKYIEGLLQAINHLNMDVKETFGKIVMVMNRIIDAFITQRDLEYFDDTKAGANDDNLHEVAEIIKAVGNLKGK